ERSFRFSRQVAMFARGSASPFDRIARRCRLSRLTITLRHVYLHVMMGILQWCAGQRLPCGCDQGTVPVPSPKKPTQVALRLLLRSELKRRSWGFRQAAGAMT